MWSARWLFALVGLLMICTNSAQQVCSNGVTGVEDFGACCTAECGTCGGAGCRSRAEAAGLTSDDCCSQRISDSGVYCKDSGTAPCIIEIARVCSNGVVGVEADGACCVAECGTCGGTGCRSRAEAVGLTSEDCCVQRISDAGVYCDDTETSPCIVNDAPVCSNGVPGVEADGVCCVAECETCGGAGCRNRARAVGLTSDDCCVQRISDSGVYCNDSETAPCIVRDACEPSLIITLEWSGDSSDVDLYVSEPDGTVVFYENPVGSFGFLDDDDTSGFGPENYIISSGLDPDSSSILGVYQARARLYDGPTSSWNLTARTFGEVVWVEEGAFTSSSTTQWFNVSLTHYDPACGGTFGA